MRRLRLTLRRSSSSWSATRAVGGPTDLRRLARRPDAKSVRVKKSKSTKAGSAPVTKFKVRCSKVRGRSHRTSLTVAQHLHTLIVKESDKADKVRAVSIAIHADSTASPIFAAECAGSVRQRSP